MKREPNPIDTRGMMNSVKFSPTHVHIKSNKVYDLICVGETESNGEMIATYWDYHGRVWHRSIVDFFNNNRFRELTAAEVRAVQDAILTRRGRHMCLRPNHDYHQRVSGGVYPIHEPVSSMLTLDYLKAATEVMTGKIDGGE